MTTTLSEGVKIPDVGSTDWADDLETNWNLLNTALAQQGSWAKVDEAQTFTGVQTFSDGIVGSLQGTANMAMSDADGNTITSTYATKTELSTLSTTVGTKANDADVVHIADAETITGAKTFSATVTSADVVPSATDTYSLGSASVQYNAVYGKSYFYNGTQWGLNQANVWTGENNFTHANINRKYNFTLGDNSYIVSRIQYQDTNSTRWGVLAFVQNADNSVYCDIGVNCLKNDGQTTLSKGIRLLVQSDNNAELKPLNNNAINLGSSTYKWKTLNGINPGALSLPSTSYTDISSYITALDGSDNVYTPTVDGWISICAKCSDLNLYQIGNANYTWGANSGGSSTGNAFVMMPVASGERLRIRIFDGTTLFYARFFPCLGNV